MDMNVHVITDNQFSNYSAKSVTIKNIEYNSNIIVTNDTIVNFACNNIKQLNNNHVEQIISLNPDLVIFGTGDKIVYPELNIIHELQKKNIGIEVMNIQALCRTFNFLVSENRKVVAILFFI